MASRLSSLFQTCMHRSYVDDTFVLFYSPNHADKFKEYLSFKYPNMNISIEKERNGCLPFLDVNIFRKKEEFASKVNRKKPTVEFIPTSKILFGELAVNSNSPFLVLLNFRDIAVILCIHNVFISLQHVLENVCCFSLDLILYFFISHA